MSRRVGDGQLHDLWVIAPWLVLVVLVVQPWLLLVCMLCI